ncbi:MAG: phosphoribosylamine--glycine ligase [Ignavibacteriales bacterium]|nr:phosphoribosylamine--glycine ligase [Ignavibacteriales bacterium]
MNVLVVGSGGREHALVWKLRRSPSVQRLYCAPGNAGISQLAELVPIKSGDIDSLLAFANQEKISLTVVGPEQPLTGGIVDAFESRGLAIFGPSQSAARLEGSKVFAKEFMKRNGIPTALHRRFSVSEIHEASSFIDDLRLPVVVKADGLAAGKGVVICETRQQALDAVQSMVLDKVFGAAGEQVVIEEFLEGEEASLFVLTDGSNFVTLAPAQDHKRILDGDKGKNTGGMGAYAPAPLVTDEIKENMVNEVLIPTLEGMKKLGTPYRGCLYCGLMIGRDGVKVLEYNCRFGDPETQVVLPLIDGDLGEILLDVARRKLDSQSVGSSSAAAACVVMASAGYPDSYETGKEISGLSEAERESDVIVFHAGTNQQGGSILTSGGRVLGVTAIDHNGDFRLAIDKAYRAAEQIKFQGAYYRRDIGQKALKHMRTAVEIR